MNANVNGTKWSIQKIGNYAYEADFVDPAIDNIQQYMLANDSGIIDDFQAGKEESTANITELCLTTLERQTSDEAFLNFFGDFGGNNLFNICITYPNMTYEVSPPTDLSKDFIANLAEYDILGDPRFEAAINVTYAATEYLNRVCEKVECDQGKSGVCELENLQIENANLTEAFDDERARFIHNDQAVACQQAICRQTVKLISSESEIGGVGVYVSYILTLGLAALLGVHMLYTFARTHIIPPLIHKARKRRSMDRQRYMLQRFHGSAAFREYIENFLKLLVFFESAIVLAAFVQTRIEFFSFPDYLLLTIVSLNGMVVTSFSMLCVLYYHRGSTYLLVQTLVGFTLCAVFFGLAFYGNLTVKANPVPGLSLCSRTLREAGKATSSLNFILKTVSGRQGPWTASFVFAILVMVGNIFWHLFIRFPTMSISKAMAFLFGSSTRRITFEIIITLVLGGCFAAVFGYQAYLLFQFWKVVNFTKTSWTFGQIIALLVWVPLLVDYLYLRARELLGWPREHEASEQQEEENQKRGMYATAVGVEH